MKRIPERIHRRLLELQGLMLEAGLAEDRARWAPLDAEYKALLAEMMPHVFGKGRVTPRRDQQVLAAIASWDAQLAAGRLAEAEAAIPEDANNPGFYRSLPKDIAYYADGRRMRLTPNPAIVSGEAVVKDPEYLHGLDGGLHYHLHLNGKESDLTVELSYQRRGRSFALTVWRINI